MASRCPKCGQNTLVELFTSTACDNQFCGQDVVTKITCETGPDRVIVESGSDVLHGTYFYVYETHSDAGAFYPGCSAYLTECGRATTKPTGCPAGFVRAHFPFK